MGAKREPLSPWHTDHEPPPMMLTVNERYYHSLIAERDDLRRQLAEANERVAKLRKAIISCRNQSLWQISRGDLDKDTEVLLNICNAVLAETAEPEAIDDANVREHSLGLDAETAEGSGDGE